MKLAAMYSACSAFSRKGMIRFWLAPPLTIISESIQPMVPSLGVKTLRSGPPWSLTRDSVPRLPVAIQASPS